MRSIVLGVCVLAAGGSGQALHPSPSPATAALAPAQGQARSGGQLPFRGSLTTATNVVIAPPNLFADGTAEGNATQLGRFTATFSAVVDLATSTGTGTFDITAANGDQLFATFIGVEGVLVEPNVARLTEVATIEGGTGRFATATGTFTLVRFDIIGEGTGYGSFDGHIDLNR